MRGSDYVIKSVGFALTTIFIAITVNFFLFRVLPGSAVTNLSRVPNATPQLRHALPAEFRLDKPKWVQYFIYLKDLAHGNMGVSYISQQPVSSELLRAVQNTIPIVTVRDDRRGLRTDGACERAPESKDHLPACGAERAAPDCDHRGDLPRLDHRGRDPHRVHLHLAGHRLDDVGGRQPAGLPHAAG